MEGAGAWIFIFHEMLCLLECTIFSVLGGKLAAEVVAERAAGIETEIPIKEVQTSVLAKQMQWMAKDPVGVKGEGAIAFGGGAVLSQASKKEMEEQDPANLVALG